jgi:predicted transcriptional regulator
LCWKKRPGAMMVTSAVAIDNADISEEAKELIRRWRSNRPESSAEIAELTDDLNKAMKREVAALAAEAVS